MNVKQKRKQNGQRVKPAHSTELEDEETGSIFAPAQNVAPMARGSYFAPKITKGI